MNIVQNIFLKGVAAGGEPGKVSYDIFETHDFSICGFEVVGTGGAETTIPHGEFPTVKIPFFARGEEGKDSRAMFFQVEFLNDGADVTVYSRD